MSLIVQKFGGTSLADPVSRELLAKKVGAAKAAGDEIVLVVSAMGRKGDPYATDTLLDLLKEFPGGADGLTNDLMVSCGEVISCLRDRFALLNSRRGIGAVPMTAYSAGIGRRRPLWRRCRPQVIDSARIQEAVLVAGKVPVVDRLPGCRCL